MAASRAMKRARAELRDAVRAALDHPPTRRLLVHIMDMSGLLSANPALSGIVEGRRQMGLDIVHVLEQVQPDILAQLLLEARAVRARASSGADDQSEEDEG
jgi:hypothetical protein